jgi:Phage-related baseplate assembly protein
MKKRLEDYPDVSFIDNMTLSQVQNELISDFEGKYEELTGRKVTLTEADPSRLILYALSLQMYQTMMFVDNAGKQGLLKYASGAFLENLGANKMILRERATFATTTLEFVLAEVRTTAVAILRGTRVGNGSHINFATDRYVEIPAGQLRVLVGASCLKSGEIGNGFLLGELNTIIDPIPFVSSVRNITITDNGINEEADASLADRIYLAPSSYSVAGPDTAYEYWVRTALPSVTDVKVHSPSPVEVEIRILVNGELPSAQAISTIEDYLIQAKVRPLTDMVTVLPPIERAFSIDLRYFINSSDRSMAEVIQQNVNTAIADYIIWQTESIGRDINSSELIGRIVRAGAKRVEVLLPSFEQLTDSEVAQLSSKNIEYRGLEND